MTRALITGAGGFCGKHLTRFLTEKKVEVHTLGVRAVSERHHFADPADLDAQIRAIKESQPDFVFHLAGIIYATDIPLYYLVNTLFAANLLQALSTAGYDETPVLLVGTGAEYGLVEGKDLPIDEETPANPYNHYGVSKLAQTQMGLALVRYNGSRRRLVMVRPFNIIGPGMPDFISLQSFARQIAQIVIGHCSNRLEVGNLGTTRDFVTVYDAVRIYWDLLQAPVITSAVGIIINVCSGRGVHMADLVKQLIKQAAIGIDVVRDPKRVKPIDVPIHYGDPSKLIGLLGYAPTTDLDNILTQILQEEYAKAVNGT